MKKNATLYLTIVLAAVVLLISVADADATQYRTRMGDNNTWYSWTDSTRWEFFYQPTWQWRNCATYAYPLPGPADEVIIQSRMTIPALTSVTIGTLRLGVADIPTASGWCYYPSFRHSVRVQGELTVLKNTYVWDDTLLIDGGTMTNHGLLFIGNNTGYKVPTTNVLSACRQCCPALAMVGSSSRLYCVYDAAASTSPYSGGLVFWPGSIESIEQGELHVHGCLIGCDDFTSPFAPTTRLFDLTDTAMSSPSVFLDGSTYPAGTVPYAFMWDENYATSPNNMKFFDLTVDRDAPGETGIQFVSHLEVHRNFSLLDGAIAAAAPRMMWFMGPLAGTWRTDGGSGLGTALLPDFNVKSGALSLVSTVQIPSLTVNNPAPNFALCADPAGAICGSIDVQDGLLNIGAGMLEARGNIHVGQRLPVPPPALAPRLDMTGSGTLRVRASAAIPGSGDFTYEPNASGSLVAGRLEVDGDFLVDNQTFAPSGSHKVVMTGNTGSAVDISSTACPPGKTNPTLILHDLEIAKTGVTPGNTVRVKSDLEIRGSLSITSGILDWNSGVGSLALSTGPGNPVNVETEAGSTSVCVMELDLAAGAAEDVVVRGLTLKASGSGDDHSDLTGVSLYLDADNNHVLDPKKDLLIAGPVFFAADDGTCTFGFSRTIAASHSESWLVGVGLYDTAAEGSTYSLSLELNTGIVTTGAQSNRSVAVTGAPVSGGELVVADAAMPASVPTSGGCGGPSGNSGRGLPTWLMVLGVLFVAARAAGFSRTLGANFR